MRSGAYLYEYLRKRRKVEYLEKKRGKFTGLTKQVNKKQILQFLLVFSEQRAICITRAPCLASQALSFESA